MSSNQSQGETAVGNLSHKDWKLAKMIPSLKDSGEQRKIQQTANL